MNKNPKGTKMKTIMSIVLACAVLFSSHAFAQSDLCDFYLPQCEGKFVDFRDSMGAIVKQSTSGKITPLEASDQILKLSEQTYPKDTLLIATAKQMNALEKVFATSNIPESKKAELSDGADKIFQQAMKDRSEALNMSQQSNAGANRSNVAATATMLNGIGRAFNNSFGQSITPPLQICTYYGGTRYCQ